MNSQLENSTRAARPSTYALSVLLLLASACSGSRSALSTQPLGASDSSASSDKSKLAACGSMTKPCDPNNLGGQTCSTLGAGSGTLLCDPVTCSFDQSMCTGSGATGGGGLGALLGAFARNQGGRAAMGQAATGGGGRAGRAAAGNAGRGGSRARGEREDSQEGEAEGGSGGEQSEDGEGGSSSSENPDAGTASPDAGSAGAGGESAEPSATAGEGGASGASAGAGGEEAGASAPE